MFNVKKTAAAIAAIAAAAAIAPGAASAATVTSSAGSITFTAGAYETNDVTVNVTASYMDIMDNNRFVSESSEHCLAYDWGVRCNVPASYGINVHLGDMHDRVVANINGPVQPWLRGGSGNDYIDVAGNYNIQSYLFGDSGDDQVYGRQFNDYMDGGTGADTLGAGYGSDVLIGGTGVDRLDGGQDNDRITAKDGYRDVIACGTGWDELHRDSFEGYSSCERVTQ